MVDHCPDKYVIVKITDKKKNGRVHYRVMGTWYGGYLDGDSYRLNSGIDSYYEEDGVLHFVGGSGSVYKVSKEMYGMSIYSQGWLESLIKNTPDAEVALLTFEEFEEEFNVR